MECTNSKLNRWNAQFVLMKKLQIFENVAGKAYAIRAIFLKSVHFAAESNCLVDG
jgi:hypothetical protein